MSSGRLIRVVNESGGRGQVGDILCLPLVQAMEAIRAGWGRALSPPPRIAPEDGQYLPYGHITIRPTEVKEET